MIIKRVAICKRMIDMSAIANGILFFVLLSMVGWCWEVAVYWCSHNFQDSLSYLAMAYRGMLHGPWVPIYGAGASLMVLMKKSLALKPASFFMLNMVLCAVLEYSTSAVLEMIFHARWWDYTGQFLNINGRICAMSILFFSLAGLAVAYVVDDCFERLVRNIPEKILMRGGLLLLIVFAMDVLLSVVSPNLGLGVRILSQ